ncbi:MAG: molybdenum cofactor guanylyltransferase [Nitrososphaerota archaeon]|jgi:molybdopterin-guanine dinucleotide biosynthesis protein A|nr:molybdenum cofactor guanylyltransferase [Nitrososphaerota archaeon]
MRFPVIILAGGLSTRMGTDKSLLLLGQNSFLGSIISEMLVLSREIVVTVGRKETQAYAAFRENDKVSIIRDEEYIESPLGGMLTGFKHVHEDYAAVLACDSPLVKGSIVSHLFASAAGRDAAVPIWDIADKMTTEPLCAVYKVESARRAILQILEENGKKACREMVLRLPSVRFVSASDLRTFDRELDSLRNINTKKDYEDLVAERRPSSGEIAVALAVKE